ncbi:hypothetical protein FB446DRAFT_645581, partial [Lentinula raphanica]
LIVGDYFKTDRGFLIFSKQAAELITWLRSKTLVLALIRDIQAEHNQPHVTVIRAVLTRWTSHYLAFKCLLELWNALEFLISRDSMRPPSDSQLITGNAKSKAKAKSMVGLVKNQDFWIALVRIKNHLEPLAIAANIMQGAFCRLDQVLLTLGSLYMHFDQLNDPIDADIHTAVLESIEKRWSKTDQEVFIAAVLLNPFVGKVFKPTLLWFNQAGILALLSKLYKRFFEEDVATHLFQNIADYYSKRGLFSSITAFQTVIADKASKQVSFFSS